jgi:hypothetical protein
MLSGEGTAATPSGQIRPLAQGAAVYSGEILSTATNSFLNLKFSDGGYVLLRPDSRFEVHDFADIRTVKPMPAASATACRADDSLQIDGCAAAAVLPLPGLKFGAGARLPSATQAALAPLADALQKQPEIVVEVDVYASDSPNAAVNRKRATARAVAIRQFLMQRGVAAQQLSTQGFSKPAAAGKKRPASAPQVELKFLAAAAAAAGGDPATALAPFASRPTQAADTKPEAAAEPEPGSHAFFRLLKGGFRAISGAIGKVQHDDYEVATPVAVIGIRGTDYLAVLCDANCAHDPIIDPLLSPDVDATGGVVFGDIGGSIVITSSKGQYVLLPNQYVLVLPDGTFIPLPSAPHFLVTDPLPDPQNCGVPG